MATETLTPPAAPSGPGNPSRRQDARSKPHDFTVEIGDSRNRNVMCPLDQRTYRGWWKKSNLPGEVLDERFANMPDLPGLHVSVSTEQRRVAVTDPLNEKDYRTQQLLKIASKVVVQTFAIECGPERDVELPNLNPTDLKSWCEWVRRMIDARNCIVIRGTVPTMREVEDMPGNARASAFDTNPKAEKEKDLSKYIPMKHDTDDVRDSIR